ncbi:MAG: SGNH/GDSL hydrolase family protein [Gammaproteobacteria bacterium]
MNPHEQKLVKCILLSACILLLIPCLGVAGGQKEPALVVFGDSLSDSGNFHANTGQFSLRPYDLIPAAPYARGGFHFSNGSTWVEQLAKRLADPQSTKPSLRSPRVFTNYAYGTARSRPGTSGFDLGSQVSMFLTDFGNQAPRGTTYVIWTGGNDVRDALGALQLDPSGATSGGILQAAVTATVDNMIALYGSGARNFLVANAPNIGLTPAVRALGPQAQGAALQLSVLYNQGLSQALDGLSALPDTRINRLDVFAILTDLVADPASAGLSNATDACITPGVVAGAICDKPQDYLFWDGIHPTRAAHRQIAEAALANLTE